VVSGLSLKEVNASTKRKAESVKIRQTMNWISTFLSLPRITDGMTDDKMKTQAKHIQKLPYLA
jgi:hypothetical protein